MDLIVKCYKLKFFRLMKIKEKGGFNYKQILNPYERDYLIVKQL